MPIPLVIDLIDSDDLHMTPHPVRRQINTAAVPTGFDQLFNHLLPVYFEFYFRWGKARRRSNRLVLFFFCQDEYPSLSSDWIRVASKTLK